MNNEIKKSEEVSKKGKMNNTLEEYKKAIRIKYETEKEGVNFDFLHHPSRGKLRDLCWLIFENKPTQDDLNVFRNLFCLDFDHSKKNKFKEQKDKFRPIETFFKGETDPTNIDAINLAAILVDFKPRPFKKFNEKCRIEEARQNASSDRGVAGIESKNETIEKESFVENKHEESKEFPKKGNLPFDFTALTNKIAKNLHPEKAITVAIGALTIASSALKFLVKKKD